VISSDDSSSPASHKSTLEPSRLNPPPLYYLPVILTSSQEAFIAKRKVEVIRLSYYYLAAAILIGVTQAAETSEKEWNAFLVERDAAINEIRELRRRVVEEEARKQAEREAAKTEDDVRTDPVHDSEQTGSSIPEPSPLGPRMDVDETAPEEGRGSASKPDSSKPDEQERKDDSAAMQADDDDAVEY